MPQERQQPTATPAQTQQSPTTSGDTLNSSAPTSPKPQQPKTSISWYKKHDLLTILEIGGLAAGGGYLVTKPGTGYKIGGGVMIGVSGAMVCVALVRGCSK